MPADTVHSRPPSLVVGIGASAGGVEALRELVAALPPSLDAAVLVVLHVAPEGTSVLAKVLDRAGPLPAEPVSDGERLRAGRVHVAPPDHHLIVVDGVLRLTRGPRVNGHRPAVDPMLASLAGAYGRSAVGVILSGTRDDGARGMYEIKAAGGTTLVQDPEEARHAGMIRSATRSAAIDGILPVEQLAARLVQIADVVDFMTTTSHPQPTSADVESATRYTCPDCGGVLWRHEQGVSRRYICSVGHAYSPESLAAAQGQDAEGALWAAARILGDRQALLDEMAAHAEQHGRLRGAEHFRQGAEELAAASAAIRRLIERGLPLTDDPVDGEDA